MTLIFFKYYFLKNVILLKPRRKYLGLWSISLTGINEYLVSSNLYFDVKSTHALSKIYIWDQQNCLIDLKGNNQMICLKNNALLSLF